MQVNTLFIILTTAILLVVGGILGVVFYYRQRTKRLKKEFGPEYDRVVENTGSQKKAEATLDDRYNRIESMQLRKLAQDERDQVLAKWEAIRSNFVDDPENEVDQADHLITEVMLARGYPIAPFDQRVDDISVNHPEVVPHYREAHSVVVKVRRTNMSASMDELRKAMLEYKRVFEELLGIHTQGAPEPEKVLA
jgi:uncharacterized protein (UPF0297 family)